jgi:hypothetical protein
MAWSAPMTAVANSVFTAAQFNTYVRDNLNETAVAKATTAGRIIVTAGANSLAERVPTSAEVLTSETTTSQSNTDLTTPGPSVPVTTGPAAIVLWSAEMANNNATSSSICDFAVSGASTRGASDTTAIKVTSSVAGDFDRQAGCELVTGLTAGSNTFTLKYWVSGATGTFKRRRIHVIPL